MMKKEFGKDYLYSKIFIEDDEPHIISTIEINGNHYTIKVSKMSKQISIEIKYIYIYIYIYIY